MKKIAISLISMVISLFVMACTPGVRVLPPEKPIEIKMNVKVEQEVRVSMTEDASERLKKNLSVLGVPTDQ